jgi:hypothetical protein
MASDAAATARAPGPACPGSSGAPMTPCRLRARRGARSGARGGSHRRLGAGLAPTQEAGPHRLVGGARPRMRPPRPVTAAACARRWPRTRWRTALSSARARGPAVSMAGVVGSAKVSQVRTRSAHWAVLAGHGNLEDRGACAAALRYCLRARPRRAEPVPSPRPWPPEAQRARF